LAKKKNANDKMQAWMDVISKMDLKAKQEEIYSFTVQLEGEGIELGSLIYVPNGREGIVVEIESIIFKTNSKIEVKGQAKLIHS